MEMSRSVRHSRCFDRVRSAPLKIFCAATLLLLVVPPQFAARQEPSLAQRNSRASDSQDAASKAAAERKKRFDEQKRQLEESGTSGSWRGDAGQTLFISPALVNMLVGDTHSFGAFDIEGRTLTGSVQWSISNSFVASL